MGVYTGMGVILVWVLLRANTVYFVANMTLATNPNSDERILQTCTVLVLIAVSDALPLIDSRRWFSHDTEAQLLSVKCST